MKIAVKEPNLGAHRQLASLGIYLKGYKPYSWSARGGGAPPGPLERRDEKTEG